LKFVAIERLSLRKDPERAADAFESGPACPCIVTDAAADWPAREKWNLDFFASRYGSSVGLAPLGFGLRSKTPGKATLLSAFIEHLGEPYDAIPGVWVGADPKAAAVDDGLAWSFEWEPFKNDPGLFDDISPFPSAIPNMTANLSREVYDALESIHRRHFDAIYISRKNTVAPLHRDWHHTFGCLVQFNGCKKVVLLPPGTYQPLPGAGFDPENPDYDHYPAMRDRLAYTDVLEPWEMLIIPPDWVHYTRSEDHSITLSKSFFNRSNFEAHMRSVRKDAARSPEKAKLFEELYAALAPAA
jgi:hypothetical protein